jgi:hypothetical protein
MGIDSGDPGHASGQHPCRVLVVFTATGHDRGARLAPAASSNDASAIRWSLRRVVHTILRPKTLRPDDVQPL